MQRSQSTPALPPCRPNFYNVRGTALKWGKGSVEGPTPDLPDKLKYNLGWSQKNRTHNPKPHVLDLSHDGIPLEALQFYRKAPARNHIIHSQVKQPTDFAKFRENNGTEYEGPPVKKQQFSLSNTPTEVTISDNTKMPPVGQRCDFWNIVKAPNFSSVQYDMINPSLEMKPYHKWSIDRTFG